MRISGSNVDILFPAYARVIPTDNPQSNFATTFPRVCRGDPYARVTTCVLTVTYMDATVWYRDGSTWKQCTVWYRNGGAWVQVVPYYRNGGTWIRV